MTRLAAHSLSIQLGQRCLCDQFNGVFEAGQFWAILGPNGVGKTTLLRTLAGLHRPHSGRVTIDQNTILDLSRRQVAQQLGLLQQHTLYTFDATVLQTALIGRHPYLHYWEREHDSDIERARNSLQLVDLSSLQQRSVVQLSGGEARRLAFATLLVQDPQIMLLDEPTNHLDLKHQTRLMQIVEELVYQQGRSAICALHDINLAAKYCSHVLLMYPGGKVAQDEKSEILTADNLSRLFDHPIGAVDTVAGTRFISQD